MNSLRLIGRSMLCGLMAQIACASLASADETLDDLAGRIEYSFYAADTRALQQSLQALEQLPVESASRDLQVSHLNYGRWKLAQLLATTDPAGAAQLAEKCSATPFTAKANAALGMQQILRAACLGMLEHLRPVRAALYQGDRNQALLQAQQTAARLPELYFIKAWLAIAKDQPQSARDALAQTVERYASAETETHPGVPRWGYAEACYWLGRAELGRGNVLAARNQLEHALVLAPDYRAAQSALKSLTMK